MTLALVGANELSSWTTDDATRRNTPASVVHFAVGLPNLYAYADPHLLVALARETEAAGWHGLFLWDHVVATESPSAPAVDPWVAMTAIAAHTERIEIGIMIVPLARRRPWQVAREAVSIDLLSGGRFRLGVGLGSAHYTEFEALGEDPDLRVRADRLDEGLEILAGLWTGEPFRFEGRYHQIAEAQFLPVATRTPRIPIWVGGTWPSRRPFRRAARWDGVFPTFSGVGHTDMPTPGVLGEAVGYTLEQRTAAGPFDVVLEGQTDGEDRAADADKVAAYARQGLTWWVEKLGWFRGSPEQVRERIRRGPPRP